MIIFMLYQTTACCAAFAQQSSPKDNFSGKDSEQSSLNFSDVKLESDDNAPVSKQRFSEDV